MTTQKCPEGNTRSSGRLFCYTAFCADAPTIDADYHCYGKEICPTTGRHHWQGFCYFKNKKSFNVVRKLLTPHHVELCRGSLQDNEKYCSKSGDYTEIGTRPSQGRRVDLDEEAARILNGETTVNDICVNNPIMFHQYGRTLERLETIRLSKLTRTEMPECRWLWGPTGVGKSHQAYADHAADDIYVYCNDNGWWDMYRGQNVCIFDDFRGDVPYGVMLRLCDKWPVSVKRRNLPPIPFVSKIIVVTSSMPPDGVYHNLAENDSLEQIYRRFSVTHVISNSALQAELPRT